MPDILEEFTHRPWHKDVECQWRETTLILTATNDYDETGAALLDEFWDAIHACVNYSKAINVKVRSVEQSE